MFAGHDSIDFMKEMKYNATAEDIENIFKLKQGLQNKIKNLRSKDDFSMEEWSRVNFLHEHLEDTILPSTYNRMKGYESQSEFYRTREGSINKSMKAISDEFEGLAATAQYTEGDTDISKVLSAALDKYAEYLSEPTPETKEKSKEAISRMTKSLEDNLTGAKEDKDDGLKKLKNFDKLEDWLKKLKSSDTKVKKLMPIEKMSDLQRVSPSEFAKPKALLMKKIINKELYCKQRVTGEVYVHCMIDNSGSMSRFMKYRNQVVQRLFNACTKNNIQLLNEFWNTSINKVGELSPKRVTPKSIGNIFSHFPDGDDRMGYCVLQKLQTLKKMNEKQYILCISDGTGSVDDLNQSLEIKSLCKSKNVELKFALFSRENRMYDIPEEDIFNLH